jgi:ABC-type transport system involved in multi-copper enzyme maturation permease subunit
VFAETLRRHLTSIAFVAFLLLLATTGLFASTFNTPGSMWPSLVTLLSIITGSGLIGPEFSTGSLQLIVSKPIRRSVYLLSRVAGVFAAVALAGVVGAAAECGGRLVAGTPAWERLANAFAGELVVSLLAISLLAFLGSMTRSYLNAAIYVGMEVALSTIEAILGMLRVKGNAVGDLLERHPGIERGLAAISDTLFAAASPAVTAQWLLRIVATIAAALLLACLAFERREVPYGAD